MAALWGRTEAYLDRVFAKTGWVGNPRIFSGKLGAVLDANPVTRWCNNALNAAPTFKWGLSLVPLYGAITGHPPVQHLDLNQSLALATTGIVWSYYALLVTPRADMLFAVSIALLCSNGFNVYRKMKYDREVAARPKVL